MSLLRAALLFMLATLGSVARADPLDVIVAPASSADARGRAYAELVSADFATIVHKLLRLLGEHAPRGGPLARTREPWRETALPEGSRIGFTLYQVWQTHLDAAEARGDTLELLLTLLEDRAIGAGWRTVLNTLVPGGLHIPESFGREVIARLDRLAFDPQRPASLRRALTVLLAEQKDPNKYLDLAIELSSAKGTAWEQAEEFTVCTPYSRQSGLTEANRRRFVRHCFTLLEQIDDDRSMVAYFLALHVGEFLGIPPVGPEGWPFVPDSRLPQYGESDGRPKKAFFQTTVANARAWWAANQAKY